MKVRQRQKLGKSVYEASKDRIRYIYSQFDQIVVGFSAGKDSTIVLNLALEVARELNKLPLRVDFYDEEAIHPPTVEYAKRIAKSPEIDFRWYCLEFKHRNACSNDEPFWYCWDKDKKDKWVRELPEGVDIITEHPKFKKGMSFQEFSPLIEDVSKGKTCMLTGVRAEESLRRLRTISNKKNDNYISSTQGTRSMAHPIYDWIGPDVWFAVKKFGWDYNTTYDLFNKTKFHNKFTSQRVCPPFGEEPLRSLWIYSQCFPEMWHKMINRVAGVGTAWRYANTNLFGIGKVIAPEGMSYKDYAKVILDSYPPKLKNELAIKMNKAIKLHYKQTDHDIHETEPNPYTGLSWQFVCKLLTKGDFKDRTAGALTDEKTKGQEREGLTRKQAELKYKRK